MSLHTCPDLTEAVPLEPSLGLYLKPVSRIKINVQLPRLSAPGQSISSWHVMERIKETVRPDAFLSLKALKIAARVIQFEGELETKAACDRALARLKAAHTLDVNGFAERLPIRAAHAACPGPTRHDWEAFFRDAKGVNEMRPGERPDTVHLVELPSRWFRSDKSGESGGPSEKLLRKAFGTFGKIRRLEAIRRSAVAPGDGTFGKTGSLHWDGTFEAYVQYEEYVEFSIAMDALRGKKLLYKEPDGKAYSAEIQVDFDRTNYLSEKCIKLREAEAKKLHSSPERTKANKDDSHKNSKPTVVEKDDLARTKETQSDQAADKILDEKEKSKELEKTQMEAKLLLKELLHGAEKHKKKMDAELEKELQKSTQKAEQSMNRERDTLVLPRAKKPKEGHESKEKRAKNETPRTEKKQTAQELPKERVGSMKKTLHEAKKGYKEVVFSKKRMDVQHRHGRREWHYRTKKEEWKESSNRLFEDRKKLILQERILKEKLLKNLKLREEEKMRKREKLRRELAGRRVLKSVLVGNSKKS